MRNRLIKHFQYRKNLNYFTQGEYNILFSTQKKFDSKIIYETKYTVDRHETELQCHGIGNPA